MTESGKTGKTTKANDRSRRLVAELRENLRRRKAQERARNAQGTREGLGEPKQPNGKQNS